MHNVLVSKRTIYLTLNSQSDSSGKVLSGIAAFNLSDGKQKWVAKPTGNTTSPASASRTASCSPTSRPATTQAGRMVTLDPGDGRDLDLRHLLQRRVQPAGDRRGLHNYSVWHDNRFY